MTMYTIGKLYFWTEHGLERGVPISKKLLDFDIDRLA